MIAPIAISPSPQAVADAGLRLDVFRLFRVGLDLLAQRADVDAKVLHVSVRPPDLAQDHVVCQHLAGMRHQQAQQFILARRKFNLVVAHHHNASNQVHAQVAGAKDRRLALLLQPMPLRGANPRQQLFDAERLGHVVVRTEIERRHLRRLIVSAGQHDDWWSDAGFPDASDHLQPIDVRQTKV